jgi:hypothetical protein
MAASAAQNLYLELIRFNPGASLGLEQLKLERLRELRATIESLRREQRDEDPLLAWARSCEHPEDPGNP